MTRYERFGASVHTASLSVIVRYIHILCVDASSFWKCFVVYNTSIAPRRRSLAASYGMTAHCGLLITNT